jgi:hypothetical protein
MRYVSSTKFHAPDARFERGPARRAIFLGGVKGFHTQRLETAKGLIDLFRQPSPLPLIPLPGARAAMATQGGAGTADTDRA